MRIPTNPTVIDLFCGCGGFSLGMKRAGFNCLAALDFNPEAIQVFRANFPSVQHVLERDLTNFAPEELEMLLGTREVDVIVGGPPCQGFSHARQVDGANHGPRTVNDPRRNLYQEFLKFVGHFRPKAFVIENVMGIRSAGNGTYFTRVQAEARAVGYSVIPRIEDATKLGVPQARKRQLFFGIREDLPGYMPLELEKAPRAIHGSTLGDAIMDLPSLAAGAGSEEMEYDLDRRRRHVQGNKRHFIYSVLEVASAEKLTAHRSRPHNPRDLRDFDRLLEGENSDIATRRGVKFEFPYDTNSFKDRYTRQHRNRPCSTIVAHLSKDGLMFIHPTQLRSLTPREAARVQTFPDWFQFPVARTHQFRVIGNAVPPLVGEAVGIAIANLLQNAKVATERNNANIISITQCSTIPTTPSEARERLGEIAASSAAQLRKVDKEAFLKGWHSLLYLFPRLHPDNALDHGEEVEYRASPRGNPLDFSRRYVRTGWPVTLAPLGKEAWRRYEAGHITEDELCCADAQRAGLFTESDQVFC